MTQALNARLLAIATVLGSSLLVSPGCYNVPEERGMAGTATRAGSGFAGETPALAESPPDGPGVLFDASFSLVGRTATPEDGEEAGRPATKAPTRLMIYSARYELLVSRVESAIDRFLSIVESAGGYLEKRENDRVTCRVPAEAFEEVAAEVRGLGKVLDEAVRAQEVTKQYFDLKLRIETAETSRERLLALLERAEKVEDILKIENEIRRLTEEIERLKGELRYLGDQIAYSTVEARFRSAAPEPTPLPKRERSRFEWINEVGVEHVLRSF